VRTSSETDGGSSSRKVGSSFRISSTTLTTFVPGCLKIASVMLRAF
jgi:hypothetical protein